MACYIFAAAIHTNCFKVINRKSVNNMYLLSLHSCDDANVPAKTIDIRWNTRGTIIKIERQVCVRYAMSICWRFLYTYCQSLSLCYCRPFICVCSLLSVHHILTTNIVAALYALYSPFNWLLFLLYRINKNYTVES